MASRASALCLWLSVLSGCNCSSSPPSHARLAPTPSTAAESAHESAAAARLVLATTSLTATTPTLVIEVSPSDVRISNAAWVQTWPSAERESLLAQHPDGIELDERVALPDPSALSHRPLYDVLTRIRALDVARAAGAGTTGGFALRVDQDAPWGTVLALLFSAAQASYVEPRFIYADANGAPVWLPIPLARAEGVSADQHEALAVAVAAALEGGEGGPPRHARPVRVRLDDDLVRVASEQGAAGPGCVLGDPSASLPADMPAAAIADCAGILRGEGTGAVELAAARSLPWSRVAPVLEALAARFPIELSASLR